MTPKRIVELNEMLRDCTAGKIFVTAFLSFTEFRKHMRNIAWETEVWIAEVPEHLNSFQWGSIFRASKILWLNIFLKLALWEYVCYYKPL